MSKLFRKNELAILKSNGELVECISFPGQGRVVNKRVKSKEIAINHWRELQKIDVSPKEIFPGSQVVIKGYKTPYTAVYRVYLEGSYHWVISRKKRFYVKKESTLELHRYG